MNNLKYYTTVIIASCLLLTPFLSYAEENSDDEPIVVHLSTEQQLYPLFLGKFIDEQSGLDSSYLEQLEKVLQYDLQNNGSTQIVPRNRQRDSLLNTGSFDNLGSPEEWKNQGVAYVLKIRVKEKQISARSLDVNSNSLKSIDGMPLTGNLSQDRRQVHQLADTIHKALFGVEGVAATRILYTIKASSSPAAKNWVSEIWEVDYDGANARKVNQDDSGYCVTPLYVPPKAGFQSASYFYVSYKNGQPKIYIAPLKGGQGMRFSYLKANQLMPAISRQRDKVAFISDITGNPDLFLQDFDVEKGAIGKPRQIYTTHRATQGSPTFSPKGDRIAFVSNKDGNPRIYAMQIPPPEMKLNDIKAKLISQSNRESTAPAWSPDGTKLAYCAKNGGDRQVWIYDFEKNEEWQLTQGGGNKENPSWAPNSSHLVFNSTGKEGTELYIINLNQPVAVKITSGSGEKRFPSWEPR